MRPPQEWLDDPAEADVWIDDPASIVARIQREAFVAGATAAREQLAARAGVVAWQLPSQLISPDVIAAAARSVDVDQLADDRFGRRAAAAKPAGTGGGGGQLKALPREVLWRCA